MSWSPADLAQLAAHGIPAAEADRQLARLRAGQQWTRLARPCTPGDGLLHIDGSRHAGLLARFRAAAGTSAATRFVPASGAATRMFQPLQAPAEDGRELTRLVTELDRFPFRAVLEEEVLRQGHSFSAARRREGLPLLLEALLEADGLNYAQLPKGLLPFHRGSDGTRTAMVEHLAETALLVGRGNLARLHFTVSTEHQALFEAHLAEWLEPLTQCYGVRFEVGFSTQRPATDTLALGPDGQPLRDGNGRLTLRPGGHGALLANLAELPGEVVLIRNIDNVVPDVRKADNLLWDALLGGLLLELLENRRALLELLRHTPDDAALCRWATAFLLWELGADLPATAPDAATLIELLDRPLRVCGMVKNSGEPGGGPFWVENAQGRLSRQIVELSQVERSDPQQAAIAAAATHFNPVIMACAMRDGEGRPYPLDSYVDHQAAIVTGKVQNGQPVRILEHPGLWNGAMAGWHTLFVELPQSTFNPVKTVFDLLRPAHQP